MTSDHKPGADSTNKPSEAKYEGLMSSAKPASARRNRGAKLESIVMDEPFPLVVETSSLLKKPIPRGVLSKEKRESASPFLLPSAASATPPRRRDTRGAFAETQSPA